MQNAQNQSRRSKLVITKINSNLNDCAIDYGSGEVSGDSCTIKMKDVSIDMYTGEYPLLMIDIRGAGLIHFNIENNDVKLIPLGAQFLTAASSVDSSEGKMTKGVITTTFKNNELEIVISKSGDSNIFVDIILHGVRKHRDEVAKASVELQIRK